jgi:hypothetical protein
VNKFTITKLWQQRLHVLANLLATLNLKPYNMLATLMITTSVRWLHIAMVMGQVWLHLVVMIGPDGDWQQPRIELKW